LQAIGSSHQKEFQAFGYIVTSAISDYVSFSSEIISKITTAVWKGNAPLSQKLIFLSSGILPKIQTQTLFLHQSSDSKNNKPLKAITLSNAIYEKLLTTSPKLLGNLHKDMHISHLILGFLDWAVKKAVVVGDENKNSSNILQMILDLIREPSLSSFWKGEDKQNNRPIFALVATVLRLVVAANNNQKKMKKKKKQLIQSTIELDEAAKEIMDELRILSSSIVNQAVAQSVVYYRKSPMVVKQRLANVLNIALPTSDKKEDSLLLPPRVALEHATASIRRKAILDLVPIKNNKNSTNNDDEDKSLALALLRHVLTEEDANMIVTSAEALERLFQRQKQLAATVDDFFCNQLIQFIDTKENSVDAKFICIRLAGTILKENKQIIIKDSTSSLLTVLIANLSNTNNSNTKINETCADSICLAFIGKTTNNGYKKNAEITLASNPEILDVVLKDSSRNKKNALISIMEAIHHQQKECNNTEIARKAIYSFLNSALSNADDENEEIESLDAILHCVKLACAEASEKQIVDIVTLAATASSSANTSTTNNETLYQNLCLPILETIGSTLSSKVLSEVLFLQIAMALSHPPAVVRLIELSSTAAAAAATSDTPTKKKKKKKKKNNDKKSNDNGFVVIFVIGLLGHSDSSVRRAALAKFQSNSKDANHPTHGLFNDDSGSKFASSIVMDGAATLPTFFREQSAKQFCQTLLQYTVAVATAKWIPCPVGCQRAISVVLGSAELAGETSFPLADRWTLAGKMILQQLLSTESRLLIDDKVVDDALVRALVQILKGTIVNDSTEIRDVILSSGRGMRSRSYSVSRSNGGVSYADPYPDGMVDAMHGCLSAVDDDDDDRCNTIARVMIQDILSSRSWCTSVFKESLSGKERLGIVGGFIHVLETNPTTEATNAFLGLPLSIKDTCRLLSDYKENLGAIATLMDYIRSNSSQLAAEGPLSPVLTSLFSVLSDISSPDGMTEDGIEYVRHSTLQGIVECFRANGKHKVSNGDLTKYTLLLVALIGGSGGGKQNGKKKKKTTLCPLSSWKSKRTALSIISALCSQNPKCVVKHMLDAFLKCLESSSGNSDGDQSSSSSVGEVITAIVPVFSRFCSAAKLSMLDVFDPFLDRTDKVTDERLVSHIHQSMAAALSSIEESSSSDDDGILSDFLCLCIARDLATTPVEGSCTALSRVSDLLKQLEPDVQVKCVRKLCNYVHLQIAIGKPVSDNLSLSTITDRLKKKNDVTKNFSLKLCGNICTLIFQTLSNQKVKEYIETSDVSSLCLELWQDLMVLQSSAIHVEDAIRDGDQEEDSDDHRMFALCEKRIDESLARVQCLLPIPVFLASVTNLIEDNEGTDLCAKALRMISERTSEVNPNSPEAALFLELLPLITGLIRGAKDDDNGMIIQQAATVVIEGFVRMFCLSSAYSSKTNEDVVFEALKICTEKLSNLSSRTKLLESVPSQLACSFALCITTLLRLLSARALPLLPKLIDAVTLFLSSTTSTENSKSVRISSDTKMLVRTSMMRTMTSIVQHLPQFLIPHLGKILSPTVITLFTDSENDLGATLAQHVPARQLLPAMSQALKKYSTAAEYETILSMTISSIEKSERKEASAVKSHALNIILLSCDFDINLMDLICKALFAMVMKISEVQLRSIYTRIRDWRGDDNANRKFAFWSISSALSRELKSIFLPCLTSVLPDAFQELEFAVSLLCNASRTSKKNTKKQKIGSIESLLYLPALISCLGHNFSADAREGGNWIREGDDKRYHTFVEPLAKLLLARVPTDFPFADASTDDDDGYKRLIVQDGGVVSCLVSLASAAGDETLWKPLNHSVLIACGDEDHGDIRRAGLLCLLKLIQTLGEEYMVLLPECLPVLSELLEADEETAALARDCVDLSEDLLGESLEDSLR